MNNISMITLKQILETFRSINHIIQRKQLEKKKLFHFLTDVSGLTDTNRIVQEPILVVKRKEPLFFIQLE